MWLEYRRTSAGDEDAAAPPHLEMLAIEMRMHAFYFPQLLDKRYVQGASRMLSLQPEIYNIFHWKWEFFLDKRAIAKVLSEDIAEFVQEAVFEGATVTTFRNDDLDFPSETVGISNSS